MLAKTRRSLDLILTSALLLGLALKLLAFLSIVPLIQPISISDGAYWVVAVVNFLNGRGFTNELTEFVTVNSEVFGAHSAIVYPPVHLLLLTLLSLEDTVQGVYAAVFIIDSLGLLVFYLVLRKVVDPVATIQGLAAGLGLLVLSTINMYGRPESTFILVLGAGLFWLLGRREHSPWQLGLLVGALGGTQPTAAVVAGGALAIYCLISRQSSGLRFLLPAAFWGVSIFAMLMSLFEPPWISIPRLFELLGGELRNDFSLWAVNFNIGSGNYLRPYFGVILAVGAVVGMRFALRGGDVWRIRLALSVVILVASLHAFLLRPWHSYNLYALAPGLLLVPHYRWASLPARLASLVSLGLASKGWVMQMLLCGWFLHSGVDLAAAQRDFERVRSLIGTRGIGFDWNRWQLSRDGSAWGQSEIFFLRGAFYKFAHPEDRVLIADERSFGSERFLSSSAQPAARVNHQLVLDCRSRQYFEKPFGRLEVPPEVAVFGFVVFAPIGSELDCSGTECIWSKSVFEVCRQVE